VRVITNSILARGTLRLTSCAGRLTHYEPGAARISDRLGRGSCFFANV